MKTLPGDWKRLSIKEATCFLKDGTHFSPHTTAGPFRYLTSKNIRTGYLDLTNCQYISEEEHRNIFDTCPVQLGDVLLTKDGASVGNVCLNSLAEPFSLLSSVAVLRGRPELLANEYLLQFMMSPSGQDAVLNEVAGQAITRITMATLASISIPIPSLAEQKAIVAILSTWDRGIRCVSDLTAAKQRCKQALTQHVLAGKRRFNGFADEWRGVRLTDVTQECDERNRGRYANASVMAVTKAEGIVPMRERTIAANTDRYQVVRKDWFAYNPMRINIGSIARHTGADGVLVSPDYVVFKCKEDECGEPLIDPDYLDHLRRSHIWERFVTAAGNGSVRIRIYFSDLGHLKFKLPPAHEQRAIADLLNTADREIDLLRKQLAAVKAQKKGLMQKLLTGQVRVRVP